jgi:hypothetical protein
LNKNGDLKEKIVGKLTSQGIMDRLKDKASNVI